MTLADPVSPDLKRHLRTLKLGQLLATLPDRLTLARQNKLPHADFLELLLSDEVTRRENGSAARRARAAGLDPDMRLDTWDTTAAVRYDQQLWNELVSLRFAEAAHGALILGPVGVGKTHLATALGHIAVRRRLTVHMARAAHLFKRLKAARLDNSTEAEHRRLAAVNLLIIDDFASPRWTRPPPATSTNWPSPGTAATPPWSPQTGPRTNGSASCTTSCSPSPPLTGSPPPATNSSSKATPTASGNAPPATQLDGTRRTPQDDTATARVVPRSWQHPGPMVLANDSQAFSAAAVCTFSRPDLRMSARFRSSAHGKSDGSCPTSGRSARRSDAGCDQDFGHK